MTGRGSPGNLLCVALPFASRRVTFFFACPKNKSPKEIHPSFRLFPVLLDLQDGQMGTPKQRQPKER